MLGRQINKFFISTMLALTVANAAYGNTCRSKILESIDRLERLTQSYHYGDLDEISFQRLVEMNDREVTKKILRCHKQERYLGTYLGWQRSSIHHLVSELAQEYENAREELLHGTERVD